MSDFASSLASGEVPGSSLDPSRASYSNRPDVALTSEKFARTVARRGEEGESLSDDDMEISNS